MNSYCKVDVIERCINKVFKERFSYNALDSYLVHNSSTRHKDPYIMTYAQHLKATKQVRFAS